MPTVVHSLDTLETRLVGPGKYAEIAMNERPAALLAWMYRQAKVGSMAECRRLAWNFTKRVDWAAAHSPAFMRKGLEGCALSCLLDVTTPILSTRAVTAYSPL